MVQIEGTYSCVKGKEVLEQWSSLGYSEAELTKLIGSHWSMKVFVDGNAYGGHVVCQEHPEFNCLEVFYEGVEKEVNHVLYGGKSKVTCTKTADGFKSVIKSEKFGEVVSIEKYTDEGVTFIYSSASHTSSDTWTRCVKIDGSYIFEKGENMVEYSKAAGFASNALEASMKSYKIHVCFKNSVLHTKEWCGGEIIENRMPLDAEVPLRYPGDKPGETPKRKALATKAGVGKFIIFVKNPNGPDEEWTYSFNDCGLVLSGHEKTTGQTCKIHVKRFTDISGTYKIISTIGLDIFAAAMGFPADMISKMLATATVTLADLGNGCQRHQIASGPMSMDFTLKLNEEFTVFHPLFNENIKGVSTMSGSVMSTVIKTSKGTLLSKVHANDTFSVMSTHLAGTDIWYKVIMEKVSN